MAQTIQQIQDEIIAAKEAVPELAVLTSTSKVSIWRLWTFVFATASWNQQKKHDLHKQEVLDILNAMKPHREEWYEQISLLFQFGHSLVPNETYYDNAGLSDADIEAARIIKYSAAVPVRKGLRIKIATESGGDLAQITAPQQAAFEEYMSRVKDAGVKLYFTNQVADDLKLEYDIYYDPLVFNADGERLDGNGNETVQDAIKAFLKQMDFNGKFVPALLTKSLYDVEGIKIPVLKVAQYRYGVLPFTDIGLECTPDAGYLRIANPSDLTINFIPYEVV